MPEALISREVKNLMEDGRVVKLTGIEIEECECGCQEEGYLIPRMPQLMRFLGYYKECSSFSFIEGSWVADTTN